MMRDGRVALAATPSFVIIVLALESEKYLLNRLERCPWRMQVHSVGNYGFPGNSRKLVSDP